MPLASAADHTYRIPHGRGMPPCHSRGMRRPRLSRAELRGALAGSAAIGLAYAAGRRAGLTRADLARRVAPAHPVAGRAAQLALGVLAALPGARSRSPARALAGGAALGA